MLPDSVTWGSFKIVWGCVGAHGHWFQREISMSYCECQKNWPKMSKFPNHYMWLLPQKRFLVPKIFFLSEKISSYTLWWSNGVIFAGNSISIFFTVYIDIINIILIFSKSSNHSRTLTIYYWNSRLLQRVSLAHLRCKPQNMMSLICHCTECTHTIDIYKNPRCPTSYTTYVKIHSGS